MKKIFILITCFIVGCSTDKIESEASLAGILADNQFEVDNVIACAANNENSELISVFFYPRPGAKNFQCYETSGDDKNNFKNYSKINATLFDVFNGYLMRFEASFDSEKWVIVTFEEAGKVHLSNPIRLKHLSKPTEYLADNSTINAPMFSWQDGNYLDTAIYFQVISDEQNNLLSGTYTYDKFFTFYELDNVVLNITQKTPANLIKGGSYNYTLMAVSEDNWVNMISAKPFMVD